LQITTRRDHLWKGGKRRGFSSVFFDSDHPPQQKWGKSDHRAKRTTTRIAGRCLRQDGRLRPPAFILQHFRPVGSALYGWVDWSICHLAQIAAGRLTGCSACWVGWDACQPEKGAHGATQAATVGEQLAALVRRIS